MNGYNNDIKQEQINKLKQLFPEAVTEGKIDWQKLQATLGEAVDLGERYGFSWKGKSDVFATIQEKAVQTLHPDIARERICRASAKIRADQVDKLASHNVSLDLGFRAYQVNDSNFKQWNELVSDPEEIYQQALSNLDLLTELLLKRSISPLVQIDQRDDLNLKVNLLLQAEHEGVEVEVV